MDGARCMSGWIKVEKSLLSDIRFTRLVRRYCNASNALRNEGVTAVLGALTQLWLYADEHIRDDDTLRATVDDINELVGINDFCGMVPVDWLVILDTEQIQLPNFLGHNGTSVKARKQNAERQANFRWRKNNTGNALRNGSNDARPDQTRPEETRPELRGGAGETRAARSTAARLPEDWILTPERKAVAEKEGADATRTFANFIDYWKSAGGQKARKHDWDAAWRIWCRREGDAKKGSAPRKTRYEEIMDKLHAS